MGMIPDILNYQLNNLIGKCFEINRMLDRGMSLLMVRWKMPNASKILHESVAHIYPSDVFADSISDYQGLRDAESIYPATPAGDRDYNSPVDFFRDFVAENREFEDMIKDGIELAERESDYTTKNFLNGLLNRLVPYTALSLQLVDMFEACENDKFKLMMLDAEMEDIIGE